MTMRSASVTLAPRSVLSDLRTPLIRNGQALILGYVGTAVIGVLFWTLAARTMQPAVLGRNSVALSVLTFISSAAQISLVSALVRFLAPAGRQSRRLVLVCYAVSTSLALVMAIGFLLLVPVVAPGLDLLRRDPWLAAWFCFSASVWSLMVLEDGVLTGLRLARWVPVENMGFSLLKAALLVPFVLVFPASGALVAWTAATLVTVVITNLYIFGRALPEHHASSTDAPGVRPSEVVAFLRFDVGGDLLWLGLTTLVPLFVMDAAGASQSARYSLDWVIAGTLMLVSVGMGMSLVAECALDQDALRERCVQAARHLLVLIVPTVVVLELAAPWVLRIFGDSYAAHGVTTLRILVASSIPFILTGTAISAARAIQRTWVVLAVFGGLFAVVVPLTLVLVTPMGPTGAAVAWLVGQTVVAGAVALGHRYWLTPAAEATPAPVDTVSCD